MLLQQVPEHLPVLGWDISDVVPIFPSFDSCIDTIVVLVPI